MPAPNLVGNWYSRGNAPFSSVTTAYNIAKSWLWQFKAMLKDEVTTGTTASVIAGVRGAVARPVGTRWTCEGSSSGAAFGMDGTDRWTATFNAALIVAALAGTNHSWIVLKSPSALGPVYLCIDFCQSAVVPGDTTASAGFIWSYHPFTGGSRNTRPRSTLPAGGTTGNAEWRPGLGSPPGDGDSVQFTGDLTLASVFKGHFAVNSNGGFHFSTARTGTNLFHSYQMCDLATNPQARDENTTWSGMNSNPNLRPVGIPEATVPPLTIDVGGAPDWSTLWAQFGNRSWDPDESNIADMNIAHSWACPTGLRVAGTMLYDRQSLKVVTLPVELYDTDSGSFRQAWRGTIADMHLIGAAKSGSAYPSSATRQQTVAGDLLLPYAVTPDGFPTDSVDPFTPEGIVSVYEEGNLSMSSESQMDDPLGSSIVFPSVLYVMRGYHSVAPTGHIYWTVPTNPDFGAVFAPYPTIEVTDTIVAYAIEC